MVLGRGSLLVGILLMAASVAAAPRRSSLLPSWALELAAPRAPGPRLIVTGRVRHLDGSPAARARVEVYHADTLGMYGRFKGTLTTGPAGQYEVRTIRPGGYVGAAPHIHFAVAGESFVLRLTDARLSGRPRIPRGRELLDAPRASESSARVRIDSSGTQRVTWDMRVR